MDNGRIAMPLNDNWRLWHDEQAEYLNDLLYLPEDVALAALAVKAPQPTGGWQTLDGKPEGAVSVVLPASVEEYLTPDGKVTSAIHGVFWFWRDVDIPASWQGKTVRLRLESYRLRAEVFVNEQLVGYDIVGDIPYSCDITKALKAGVTNRIAVRITNPGGNKRGWEDYPAVKWGAYSLPASRDFGSINGNVELIATDATFIDDVFVKNLNTTDYRTVEVQTSLNKRFSGNAKVRYELLAKKGNKVLFSENETVTTTDKIVKRLNYPQAKLWSVETPEMYRLRVTIEGDGFKDVYTQPFGFRVFEVKRNSGNPQTHYYLNGKRFVFKGAIDFGYYAYTGSYPTEELAVKSILAAKRLGQNGFNFHRRIGYPIVLQKADEMGHLLYEEPGGFHAAQQGYDVAVTPFCTALMLEKLRRMVIRDRNHPSLLFYNLCNEDMGWNDARKTGLTMVAALDGTRLVTNSSGSGLGNDKDRMQYHIRPYETEIRQDYMDNHTAGSDTCLNENDFNMHNPGDGTFPHYWGEVKSYCAPDDWTETARSLPALKQQKTLDYKGYNYSHYLGVAQKVEEYFNAHRINKTGSRFATPDDFLRAVGSSKMYNEGRQAQTIMSYDANEGYAINAWSGGNGFETMSGWYSGLTDDNRNIKGNPDIYAYYTRPLQVVIRRNTLQQSDTEGAVGGKYFAVGGKASFYVGLINQYVLPAGEYTLRLRLKDGAGIVHPAYDRTMKVAVKGGDVFAQPIDNMYVITLDASLRGGFITLEGELLNAANKKVADGAEQVLLANRSSFAPLFKGLKGEVYGWQEAKDALIEAQAEVSDFANGNDNSKTDFIAAAGDVPSATLDAFLAKVQSGARLLLRFDSLMAARIFEKGILTEPVTTWGAPQTGNWWANGFGYIDHFAGATVPLNRNCVSVKGWEMPSRIDNAFEPFSSNYKTSVYGVYIARPDVIRTILGAIDYGKGKILLQAAYPVDAAHPFNDLLFYNLLTLEIK
jgi:hypothetical protein